MFLKSKYCFKIDYW